MAIGYFLRVGDKTTCGGQIITGDDTFKFYGSSATREGDRVTCGKHSGTYQILGGISYILGNNRRIAGTLDSFSSCPCKSKLINSIQDCYVTESSEKSGAGTENNLTNKINTTTDQPHHIRYLCTDDNNTPLANCEYQLYLDDNQSFSGITDPEGYTSWHKTNSASPESLTIPTHWIVWDGPVTQIKNGDINLRLFSWGIINELIKENKDVSFFIKRFFGGMVFKPLK